MSTRTGRTCPALSSSALEADSAMVFEYFRPFPSSTPTVKFPELMDAGAQLNQTVKLPASSGVRSSAMRVRVFTEAPERVPSSTEYSMPVPATAVGKSRVTVLMSVAGRLERTSFPKAFTGAKCMSTEDGIPPWGMSMPAASSSADSSQEAEVGVWAPGITQLTTDEEETEYAENPPEAPSALFGERATRRPSETSGRLTEKVVVAPGMEGLVQTASLEPA